MEFPGNCPTNVLKIVRTLTSHTAWLFWLLTTVKESHSAIHYSVYTVVPLESDPQNIDTLENTYLHTYPVTPPSNPPTGVIYKSHKGILRKAEKLFRDRGANVVSRLDRLELWLFESGGDAAAIEGGQKGGHGKADVSSLASEGLNLQSKGPLSTRDWVCLVR
jgi:hypothetical protein